ncbi:MAG: hypothetical protein UH734_02605 [Ruminococcus sp.]|nr:hypothetical protein [Ruminococcus sp.]
MKLLNAEKGIKKIIVSEIVAILAAVMSSAASLFLGIQLSVDQISVVNPWTDAGWGTWGLVSGLIAISFLLIQLGFGFVGYVQAARDEACFKNAMICTIAGSVLMIVGSSVQSASSTVSTVLSASGTIVEMFVMVYAIIALLHLAEKCDRPDMINMGTLMLKILVITYIVSALNALIIRIFELSSHARIVAVVTGAVDLVLSVMQYVLFMVYLQKTKKMLAQQHRAEPEE